MSLHYNPSLKKFSKNLRKEMTDAEHKLWRYLQGKQIKNLQFYRQKIIGNYIVDFYCPAAKIIIEVDGSQHYRMEGLRKDKIRDEYLLKHGFKILRFNDLDVLKNIEGVFDSILEELNFVKQVPPLGEGRIGGISK